MMKASLKKFKGRMVIGKEEVEKPLGTELTIRTEENGMSKEDATPVNAITRKIAPVRVYITLLINVQKSQYQQKKKLRKQNLDCLCS